MAAGQRADELDHVGQPEQVQADHVSGFLEVLGPSRYSSGAISAAEGEVGKEFEVILTHKIWRTASVASATSSGKKFAWTVCNTLWSACCAGVRRTRVQSELYVPLAFRPEQINHDSIGFWYGHD